MQWATTLAIGFVAVIAGGATTQTTTVPTSQSMPRQALDQLYAGELGKLYRPESAEQLHRAHTLLEEYFARTDDRRSIAQALAALGIAPEALGRLIRIRSNWPELAGGVYYINERIGPHSVRYFLGIPRNYDRAVSWPLVIKLPAADAFVGDPRPDAEQVAAIYRTWMLEELSCHPDAVLIMPLLNLDELWGPSYAGMNNVIQPMHHAASRVNIDPARVYLVGHSMSAHATWNLALHYTTYFAAFNALAGGAGADWQRLRLMGLRNVLPVVWHDADDTVISVEASRQLVKALRILKCDVDYEETKTVGHIPSSAIAERCYQRMRARTRELYPRRVSIQSNRPDTMFNRNDWVQIYQPLRTGEEQRLIFARGGGYMVVYPQSFRVEATIIDNRINVVSQNVESMRFYLNEQLVDPARPVTVVVNGKTRFEGLVDRSIDEMLKDQLFLGRGWRYYTAVIDVDFAGARPATTRSTTAP